MLEQYLIFHCAPTLASIKCASLFCLPTGGQCAEPYVQQWNDILEKKGVMLHILRSNAESALIYVYRPSRLQSHLCQPGVGTFLLQYGYPPDCDMHCALSRLQSRLQGSKSFPHEIGVFLGYPLDDVKGFIHNKGKNYMLCGYWKVYCNVHDAQKAFAKMQKCREVYRRLWQQGQSILQLTVAA